MIDGFNHDVSTSPSDDYAKLDELPRFMLFDDLVQVGCSLPHAVCDGVSSTDGISNLLAVLARDGPGELDAMEIMR